MNLNVKDEILTEEPKYRIKQNGATLYDNVVIEMITAVQQQGTPINKALFDTIGKYLIPAGLICMWNGTVVPTGWHLCDGTNGTPDLRDRFVVGSGNEYEVGNIGGEKTHQLTIEEMPRHSHSYSHPTYAGAIINKGVNMGSDETLQTGETGGNQPHENRPPYYALAYIMKINE